MVSAFHLKPRCTPLTEQDLETVSTHEAGHNVVGAALYGPGAITNTSIVREHVEGENLGVTEYRPPVHVLMRRKDYIIDITMALAGRVAEQVFLGEVSRGGKTDMQDAQGIATQMVTRFGMSGYYSHRVFDTLSDLPRVISRTLYEEVQEIIDECAALAEQILRRHESHVRNIATRLCQDTEIQGDDLQTLLRGITQQQVC